MVWLTIFIMGMIVFSSRYLFLEPKLPIRLSERSQRLLSYSAPAVLTAIFAPIIFIRNNELALSLDNPYLISGIAAVVLARMTGNTLLTTVFSMGIFFGLNFH